MNKVISTLCIGDLYEKYCKLLLYKLSTIVNEEIHVCITTNKYFNVQLDNTNIKYYFNILPNSTLDTPYSDTINRTTLFKYFYKTYAIKYAAHLFPTSSICHIDVDMEPQNHIIEFLSQNHKPNTIYVRNYDINCQGGYGKPIIENNNLRIHDKLKFLVDKLQFKIEDYSIVRFPIENTLFFYKIDYSKLIDFCNTWYEIGSLSNELVYPYCDCFEIQISSSIHGINIRQKEAIPFSDAHRKDFEEFLTNNSYTDDITMIKDFLDLRK
jgi:hypothetical protein